MNNVKRNWVNEGRMFKVQLNLNNELKTNYDIGVQVSQGEILLKDKLEIGKK